MELNLKKTHIIEYFLPFYPLLSVYNFSGVPMETVGLTIIAFLILSKHKFSFRIYREFYPYFIFFAFVFIKDIITTLFGGSATSTSVNRLILYTFQFILVFIVCADSFDDDKLFKVWKIAGILYGAGLIYHLITIVVFKTPVVGISLIPGYSFENLNNPYRPKSFFYEPSSFVAAMIPLLFLALKKKDYLWAIGTTLLILASTSTLGVVLSFVLWGLEFSFSKIKRSKKIILVIVIIFLLAMFFLLPFFSMGLLRAKNTLDGGGSFTARVTSGFELIEQMDIKALVFGTLYNEPYDFFLNNYFKFSHTFKSVVFDGGGFFVNTFSLIVFRYGFVGLILYFNTYRNKILKGSYGGKYYAIICLISIFGDTLLLNAYYFLTTIILLSYSRKNNTHRLRKKVNSR